MSTTPRLICFICWARQTGRLVPGGDFNYDGVINYLDYALIDAAYTKQTGGPLAAGEVSTHAAEFGAPYIAALDAALDATSAAVPEPTSLALLALGTVGWKAQRQPVNLSLLFPWVAGPLTRSGHPFFHLYKAIDQFTANTCARLCQVVRAHASLKMTTKGNRESDFPRNLALHRNPSVVDCFRSPPTSCGIFMIRDILVLGAGSAGPSRRYDHVET